MAIEKKNAWEKYPQGPEREKLFAFAEDYRRFISGCKTERECTASVYADATGHGFVDLDVYLFFSIPQIIFKIYVAEWKNAYTACAAFSFMVSVCIRSSTSASFIFSSDW